jgi:hypothetical protein
METKPKCKLIGMDGNVFAIIGNVKNALNKAGQKDRAKEFCDRALKAGSYDEVLSMLNDYVKVT